MFALVDCDQFFVSCERVFRPDLWHKPVAVLSNNDGCVIARSPEVKALGIQMGEPWFQCHHVLQRNNVAIFSSNFSLYADLSHRVIKCIKVFIESQSHPRVEVYSIDEAFIDLKGLALKDLYPLAQELRLQVWRHTGIPVSIGIGASKTLAKVATHFAKRSNERVKVISTEHDRLNALYRLPLGDIWGIGQKWSQSLRRLGIESALDLAEAPVERIKLASRHSYLQRTARELNGQSCHLMNFSPPPRASIQHSRTFSRRIYTFQDLLVSIELFATELGRRLRSHQRRAGTLVLYLSASRPKRGGAKAQFSPTSPVHNTRYLGQSIRHTSPVNSIKIAQSLDRYTDDSSSLIKTSRQLLKAAFLKAYQVQLSNPETRLSKGHCSIDEALASIYPTIPWRKASLLALDLRDHSQLELSMFRANPRKQKLSQLEDQLNQRFGRGAARIGGLPNKPHICSTPHPKSQHRQLNSAPAGVSRKQYLSPRYTTCWADLPIVWC